MVYGFVKQSGGHVTINSEPGRGTTVALYLPVTDAARMPVMPTAPASTEIAQGHGESILFLDDDPEIREMAGAMLRDLGYQVVLVDGPAAALRAHKAPGGFQIMISDILLGGGMRGHDVVDPLKRDRE